MDFHDIAQYEEGANEPEPTGAEAWAEYQAGSGAILPIPVTYPGEVPLSVVNRSLDEVFIRRVLDH